MWSPVSINGLKVSTNGLITEQVLVLEAEISLPNDVNAHLYYRQSVISADYFFTEWSGTKIEASVTRP